MLANGKRHFLAFHSMQYYTSGTCRTLVLFSILYIQRASAPGSHSDASCSFEPEVGYPGPESARWLRSNTALPGRKRCSRKSVCLNVTYCLRNRTAKQMFQKQGFICEDGSEANNATELASFEYYCIVFNCIDLYVLSPDETTVESGRLTMSRAPTDTWAGSWCGTVVPMEYTQ
jgi:hypothetical protein